VPVILKKPSLSGAEQKPPAADGGNVMVEKYAEQAGVYVSSVVHGAYDDDNLKADLAVINQTEQVIAGVAADIKKLQAKKKALEDVVEPARDRVQQALLGHGADPDATLNEVHYGYRVEVGKCGTQRVMKDIALAAQLLGDTFWQLATIPIGKCDDYLTLDQREKVLETKRTDKRPFSVKIVGQADGQETD
jgi:hypothetical protein